MSGKKKLKFHVHDDVLLVVNAQQLDVNYVTH